MAAHTIWPPPPADALVRGDPTAFILRLRTDGVDEDLTGRTFRSYVRDQPDGNVMSVCETFEIYAPDDLPEMFPDEPGATPCVLIVYWAADQTATWKAGYVADVEQMTPTQRTWLLIDNLRVDKDVSYTITYPPNVFRRRLLLQERS